jgi:hypothetical protein
MINAAMKSILLSLVLFPVFITAQISYNTDDQFSLFNASSFSNQKIYSTVLAGNSNLNNLDYFSVFILHKQKVKAFSIGINSEFTRFKPFLLSKSEIQIGYPYQINRKFMLNSGLGLSVQTDNYLSTSSWNPAYFGLNPGISLVSKKGQVGLSFINITGANRTIDSLKFRVQTYASIFASYDFKLDTTGNLHFIPSLYFEFGPFGFNNSLVNIKFKALNNSLGVSYSIYHPAVFYQHQLKNGVTVGVSVGKYWSPLNSSFDKSWNGMVRLNYSFKRKGCKFTGTPSF